MISTRHVSDNIHLSVPRGARLDEIKTVNGAVVVRWPEGAGMRLSVATVHGNIESDFDLPVRKVGFGPGRSLETTVGQGGANVNLRTVNGSIRLEKR